ncbi:DUF2752 domain-containing protein [Dysosmobacter sp. Marseille-Q4140]|nr:DUF2752 domain-containing protein [Dysosmobacter sp. Marseille-Q4140]
MDERRRMTDREVYPAAWILVGMLALAYLIWRYALGSPTVSRCWVWEHWGLYCPGCGGTRAVIALAHGQLLKALYYHPAVPVLAALGGVYLVSQTVWRMRGRRGWVLRYDPRWPAALAGLFLVNCAVRNLLWLGFDIGI